MSAGPSNYGFYAAMLRFVASKTDPQDARMGLMMAALSAAAEAFETQGRVTVAADRLEVTARAFAGLAAFLQRRILPEAVAAGHADGERQIRWAVDSAMAAVNILLAAAARPQPEVTEVTLPPPS